MGLLDAIKRAFGGPARPEREPAGKTAEEAEIAVLEVTVTELLPALQHANGESPLLLDCREEFERRQSYIPGSLHIPMNSIPYRLAEVDHNREIIVYCAHGNRSYGVAGWLTQQGYRAASLKGGIADWQRSGGATQSGIRRG